jgi:uncharacterized membrane protein YhaH (DUF805 family)
MQLVIDSVTKKYAAFAGRASRREFWLFFLAYTILYIAALVIDIWAGFYHAKAGMGIISGIFFLLTIIPYLAISLRRLHDTNRTGWWFLISLVPLIGMIWLIVLLCSKGTSGENSYGSDPLAR